MLIIDTRSLFFSGESGNRWFVSRDGVEVKNVGGGGGDDGVSSNDGGGIGLVEDEDISEESGEDDDLSGDMGEGGDLCGDRGVGGIGEGGEPGGETEGDGDLGGDMEGGEGGSMIFSSGAFLAFVGLKISIMFFNLRLPEIKFFRGNNLENLGSAAKRW